MGHATSAEQAVGELRQLLDRSEPDPTPPEVYLLWAVLIPIGFGLVDLRSGLTGPDCWVARPAGFLLSTWLGSRASRKLGQRDHREGTRHVLHWVGMMGGLALLVPLALGGMLTPGGFPRAGLLVVALSYFLNGVHQDRPLLWIGLLAAGGYLLTFLFSVHVWSIVGGLLSLALIATALNARRRLTRIAAP